LSKTNSTSIDQHRARFNLSELMHDPRVETDATKKLALVLRQPGLPIERIDLILQTLLETRAKTDGNPSLPAVLVQSLRTGSVDTRTRINDVLKHFVEVCGAKFDEGTTPWKPSDGDSTTFLEMRVRRWADFWGKNCPARP
jgi:hypothetical protein